MDESFASSVAAKPATAGVAIEVPESSWARVRDRVRVRV